MFKDVQSLGIDLEINEKVGELQFLVNMHRFINKRGKILSYIEETKITIETIWFDPLMIIEVDNGIMSFIPTADDGFHDAFIEVLFYFWHVEKKKKPKPKIDPNAFEWI